MMYIRTFQELDKNDIAIAGGKGANLGEMTAAGFAVPPGFVLTTAAYDAFVETHGLQRAIVEAASAVSMADPLSSEAASTQIRRLFMGVDIPEDIASALLVAYAELGVAAVAVRSSATAEDLPTASFAGQQDTYLNIKGDAALLDAVKQCWASLWTARAIAYRLRQGIAPASVSLAVVVQHLIPADRAGILFTANPINGQRGQMLINAAWGLGEAIVGGQVTPDTIVVDTSNWKIISRDTPVKALMTVRTDTGTVEQPVPKAQQQQPVLDDATSLQLARYAERIATHYSMPMDLEWALADGEITILQARPITSLPVPQSLPPVNVVWEPVAPNTIWMRRQIVEHMPEPLSPLFEDLYLKQGIDQAMTTLMKAMSEISGVTFDLASMLPAGFTATINGYAYTAGSFNVNRPNLVAILRIYSRLFRFLNVDAFNWEKVVLPQYQATIARWQALDHAEITDEALLQGIRELAAADSIYWFGSAVNLGLSRVMDAVFDQFLKSPLIRYALPRPRPVSASFLRGFASKALDAQADMERLAGMIRESEPLRDLVLTTPINRMLTALAAHPEGQPMENGLRRYLDTYGHQIYNLDFVAPTQYDDPTPVWLSLKALVQTPGQDVRVRQAEMAQQRDRLITETMQVLNPISRRLFGWVWKWTKQYAPYRESVMFYMGAAWPTLRMLARELGQRLTDAGTITDPDDIYYLDSADIAAACYARAHGQSQPELARRVQARRELREARKQLTPPPKVPDKSRLKVGPIDLSMFDPTPRDAPNEGSILKGHAVSTGHITAPASVIRSTNDFDKMNPGTILVAATTTPAWTPLFSQATGLVTDIGGALAHGSIVAREYGIPAVMGTGNATHRIHSGQMIRVDGDTGTVTLLDYAGQEAEVTLAPPTPTTGTRQRTMLRILLFGAIVGLLMWWISRWRSTKTVEVLP